MPLHGFNFRRHEVANLLRHSETFDLSRMARQRLAWFAYALAHEGNVSLTCRYFGISRSTFLRWATRFDPRRPETLEERSRRPHHVRAPKTAKNVVELIRTYRRKFPTLGKAQIAGKLQAEHHLQVSASTVGRVIARERLFFADLPSHQYKRTGLDLEPGAPSKPFNSSASLAPDTEAGEAGVSPASDFPVTGS